LEVKDNQARTVWRTNNTHSRESTIKSIYWKW